MKLWFDQDNWHETSSLLTTIDFKECLCRLYFVSIYNTR